MDGNRYGKGRKVMTPVTFIFPGACIWYPILMRKLLLESLSAAMLQMKEQACLVGLNNINESTFRFLVMAELQRNRPDVRLQAEWEHHVDLLLQCGKENALVEFKFYVPRRLYSLTGQHIRWKGGAGLKNQDEFRKCVKKLRALQLADIHHRFLVLAYAAATEKPSKYSPAGSYGSLESFGIDRVDLVDHTYAEMVCKLIDLC